MFPDFDDNLRQAFQRETEMLFESILREDRSVLDLLDADYTFVNERLARHYGIPNVYGPDFRRVPVPSDARRGLLGQGSLLLVTSNANRTSPVHARQVDSGEPARQPAAAAAAGRAAAQGEPDGAAGDVGARADRAASRESGVRRLPQDHGPDRPGARELRRRRPLAHRGSRASTIDASGQLVDGTPVDGPAAPAQGAARPSATRSSATMTEKLLMYGVGRETKYYDMPAVRAVMRDAAQNRYRFSDLVLGIVKSAPFQMRVERGVVKRSVRRSGRTDGVRAHDRSSRRNICRAARSCAGMGVTLALPLLDSMVPARTALAQTAATPEEPVLRHLRAARRHDGQVDAGDRKAAASSSPRR